MPTAPSGQRRFRSLLPVLALVGSAFLAPPRPMQAADCQFYFGFKVLHDMIPAIVGDCLENERHNPENGDGLQTTTRGLLVWRKVDNWTAFTDGSTTWINGPLGLQSRSNNEHFPWEAAAAPAPAAPPQSSAPAPAPQPPAPPLPAPTTARGPVTSDPANIVLRPEDMGKQIGQSYLKTDSDDRASWAEVLYERDPRLIREKLGPIRIVNRAYVANDVDGARAIYAEEVDKQARMPEKKTGPGGLYVPEGINVVGEEQDSLAGCDIDCDSRDFRNLHQRTVMRYQNAVIALYFFGAKESATPDQMNEWLPLNRERMQ